MDNTVYWLMLQGALGYGYKAGKLVKAFGDAYTVYHTDSQILRQSGVGLTPQRIGKIKDEKPENYYEVLEICKKHSIHLITPDSEYYPPRLREIEDLPLVLYVRGDCECLTSYNAIGVIGSRTPSEYGVEATETIVSGLCKRGSLIVSGGAVGIDTVAHTTAIENAGKTVLVMGCGHGAGYLPENSGLRKRVAANGALITEFPPYYNVTQFSFPQRNRIISGISDGVVIAEAAQYSGTFSTARHAVKQGRRVYVLPGDINSGNYEGSNRLIIEGATPIFSAEDILSLKAKKSDGTKNGLVFDGILSAAPTTKKKAKKSSAEKKNKKAEGTQKEKNSEKSENIEKINMETISKNAGIVYNIMSDGICDLDSIVRQSDLPVRKVLTALTELEMKGIAFTDGPNCYRIK